MSAAALLPPMPKQRERRDPFTRKQPSATPATERVVLTGFMGSGKSTVGALLAQQLGWEFLDLDAEIERRCGMPVAAIFAELGEAHFRHHEASALAALLGRRHVVIALGGGAPEALGNRLLLEQTPATAVVFLHAPFAVLHERCMLQASSPEATVRPLFASREQAEARYNARLRVYEQIATVRLDTSVSSADETAETIAGLLKKPY